ncbi:hypothetical protein PQX77_021702 [Marasmius sp. AFHP31]|nr:hypothetical protein PQX77_021702 [Marasmius sp. AFHP31]
MSSQFFPNAQNFQITGGNFSHIYGDQINYTTTIVQAERKELTVLDEYYYVKRGAIYKLKENGRYLWEEGEKWSWRTRRRARADRISYAVEIVDRPGRVFTLVEYIGPEAKQAFEKDFAMLISGLTLNGPQVYGYNLSAAPSMLMYNELVPAAQVNAGIVGRIYLYNLQFQLGCETEELWLDLGKGVFCRGPPGPKSRFKGEIFCGELPLTAELVQEDVLLRFLAGLKSEHVDEVVVGGVAFSGALTDVPERVLRPTVISTLTNAPIAVANNTWTSFHSTLSDQKLLTDGMTRFTLNGGDYRYLPLRWNSAALWAWMAQAWSVFGARGISMEEDLSVYHLVYPYALMSGDLSDSEARQRSQQPIYLFVRPSLELDARNTSSMHFWSFDGDGQSPLSHNLCLDFGLPTTFRISQFSRSYSWSNHAYNSLRQYQLPRGFDPSTTDFARSLGYDKSIYQTPRTSDRFAQVDEELPLEHGVLTSTAQISALEHPTTTHPAQKSSESTPSSTHRTSLSIPPGTETAVKHDAEPESMARLSTETEGPSTHWAKPGFLKKWCNLVSQTVARVNDLDYSVVAC